MRILLLAFLLLLTACGTRGSGDPHRILQNKNVPVPTPEYFVQCHGYGCQFKTSVELTKKDWKEISKIFKPKPKNAEKERNQIAKAIGLFEKKVGAITGTDEDIHGTFKKTGRYQLDCSDESINTTMYLLLLQQKELLRFHTVSAPDGRFPIIHAGGWPHKTAVIVETKTSTPYAVDSWFYDNGVAASIVPLDDWKKGWKPADFAGG